MIRPEDAGFENAILLKEDVTKALPVDRRVGLELTWQGRVS